MKKFKGLKSVLLTTSVTLGLSLSISGNAFAATYTTVSGDSLYKISQIFNTSITSIMNDNNLSCTMLNIGQNLYVPCETYTVHKGDTLYLISKKYNITLSALRRANNIYTNMINIGQVLNIPKLIAVVPSITPTNTNTTTTATTVNCSESDLDLLSRLIMAEAQGEPYDAKVAVGAVVINRMKSGLFPNSISGVINQTINGYYQFTPVLNGWINKPADADSIKAAKEALSGVDPTNGALFYFDNSTTNTWLLSKTVATTIDKMIFCY